MMVSIIVPVYNVEKYIIKCLDSIYRQTYKNFELIIVNDGTKDNSISLIEQWKLCKKIPIKIVTKTNEGLPQARRTGLQYANGEYILFIDSDDWIESDMLERMIVVAENEKCDIVSCGIVYNNNNGETLAEYRTIGQSTYIGVEAIKSIHDCSGVYVFMWNKLFRREVLSESYFPTGHFVGEDYCTLMNLLKDVSKVVHIPDLLYHYIQHSESMVHVRSFDEAQYLSYRMFERYREDLVAKYPQMKVSIYNYHMLEQMAVVNLMVRSNTYDEKILNDIQWFVRKHTFRYICSKNIRFTHKFAAMVMTIHMEVYKWSVKLIMKSHSNRLARVTIR